MSGSGSTYYDEELKWLFRLLKSLPETVLAGDAHNFAGYLPDMAKVKETGCVKTVVSHALQVSFGPRKAPGPDGQEIVVTFKSRGVALEEVVSVLRTGNAGENRLLTGWVDSLTKAGLLRQIYADHIE
ncbi:hypothetical protein B0H10DRAFT_1955328 [Mycena sp. CBHHK59/15]|nr:hypothetical protein B0H10DRAFT_1956329 [Mycena sp. CBHHK59/15]KAJ6608555.1 hypothetical protein B0H10DRAFT_1955328 [Mycena sp. CBHHK59/15]